MGVGGGAAETGGNPCLMWAVNSILLSLAGSAETPGMGSLAPCHPACCAAICHEPSPCLDHYLPAESPPCLLVAPGDMFPEYWCALSSHSKSCNALCPGGTKKYVVKDVEEKDLKSMLLGIQLTCLDSWLFTEEGGWIKCKKTLLMNCTNPNVLATSHRMLLP